VIDVVAACRLGTFSLDVAFRSECRRTVLFGPSGAGKTMTLQCMAGFVTPPRGYVAVGDAVLLDTARGLNVPPWRRRVGAVLQGDGLFPHLSVADNVRYGMRAIWRGREATRALALLASVGLTGYGERRPLELSAGEQQRVALARALASDPRALLLDEPFTGVDAPVREQLRRDLLALIESRGLPAVVVTHDFDEIHVLGEMVVVLVAGQVVQTGSATDLARRPRTATVARLVGASNVLAGEVLSRDGASAAVQVGPFVLRVAPRAGLAPHIELCVRPEDLRLKCRGGLVAAGSQGGVRPAVEGRVRRVLARRDGATVLLTAGRLELEAYVAGVPPAPGDTVEVAIPDGAAHVLEPEAGPRAHTPAARLRGAEV
jgi:molybdate transport system ATP-binding protein